MANIINSQRQRPPILFTTLLTIVFLLFPISNPEMPSEKWAQLFDKAASFLQEAGGGDANMKTIGLDMLNHVRAKFDRTIGAGERMIKKLTQATYQVNDNLLERQEVREIREAFRTIANETSALANKAKSIQGTKMAKRLTETVREMKRMFGTLAADNRNTGL